MAAVPEVFCHFIFQNKIMNTQILFNFILKNTTKHIISKYFLVKPDKKGGLRQPLPKRHHNPIG